VIDGVRLETERAFVTRDGVQGRLHHHAAQIENDGLDPAHQAEISPVRRILRVRRRLRIPGVIDAATFGGAAGRSR
jgi:hypothetical protein